METLNGFINKEKNMKVTYNFENETREYKCESCGYLLKTQRNGMREEPIIGDEKFIELGSTETIKDKGGRREQLVKIPLYACPKCGCVHIRV